MARKIVVMMAAVLAMLTLWVGVAGAQASPASVQATEATVQGEQIARPLARTGTNAMPEIYVGAGLAAAGVVLVVAARRRKHAHLTVTN